MDRSATINAATSKGTSLLIHRSISTEIILLKSSSEKQIMQNQRTLLTTSRNAKSAIDTKRYNCICSAVPTTINHTSEQRDFATSCHMTAGFPPLCRKPNVSKPQCVENIKPIKCGYTPLCRKPNVLKAHSVKNIEFSTHWAFRPYFKKIDWW